MPKAFPPVKKKNRSSIAQSDFEKAEEFYGRFTDVFTKIIGSSRSGSARPAVFGLLVPIRVYRI